MMRGLMLVVSVLVFSAVSGYFLYTRSASTSDEYQTAVPFFADIERTIVANGTITPRQEVVIKPHISGVIKEIYVMPGDAVTQNDLLALIQPYPDPIDVSEAESKLRDAQIRFKHQQREFTRTKQLYKKRYIPRVEFEESHMELQLAKQNLGATQRNVEIVRSGASTELDQSASEIRATVSGLVLERTVEVGAFVIESNEFNVGTSIVTIADMADLLFKGQVDEPDAGLLAVGMPVTLTVGAFPEATFTGAIEFLSPKALVKDGRTTFEVRSSVTLRADRFVRAGYSAVANIVVARREQVLAISERNLLFKDGQPFVPVEIQPKKFEDRMLTLGLSDGLVIEVQDGLQEEERFRILPVTE